VCAPTVENNAVCMHCEVPLPPLTAHWLDQPSINLTEVLLEGHDAVVYCEMRRYKHAVHCETPPPTRPLTQASLTHACTAAHPLYM
jgi:hypothetical protein